MNWQNIRCGKDQEWSVFSGGLRRITMSLEAMKTLEKETIASLSSFINA